MVMRKSLFASLLLATGALAAPLISSAAVDIDIDIAPPVPRVEVVPAARVGYVWAPGYWVWQGGAHVWVAGHWMAERRGFHWVPEHWVQNGPHWHFVHGHWAHD